MRGASLAVAAARNVTRAYAGRANDASDDGIAMTTDCFHVAPRP